MHARRLLAPVLAAATVFLAASPALADATITSTGPLVEITTTDDLNCAVRQQNDNFASWYQDIACGTFLAVDGGTLYGPAELPAGINTEPRTGWTPVSQSSGGTGSEADPFVITTTVTGADDGITVVQTDTYVQGASSYLTDVELTLATDRPEVPVILYRAGDCQVNNTNFAFGNLDEPDGPVSCQSVEAGSSPPVRGDRIIQLLPVTEGSIAQEGRFSDIWQVLGDRVSFNGECVCDPPLNPMCGCTGSYDNGIGLSWSATLLPGTPISFTTMQTFTPLNLLPLITDKTVDQPEAMPGDTVTYTMTLTNPNSTDVTTETFTDLLPEGFTYVPGSTTGAITDDPTQTVEDNRTRLTWVVEETLGEDQSVSILFDIVVAARGGVYDNEASGTTDKDEEAAPFEGATVTVTSAPAPVIPEVPLAVLLPLGAAGMLALAHRRRTA